jgi:hypothetical protein
MRELTEKEKKLCRALVEKDEQEHHQFRVGDVLHNLLSFECIEKDKLGEKYPDSPFKIRLTCINSQRQDTVDDLNEAISLLLMLKDKGMISFVDSKSDECFGDNTPKKYGLQETEHSDAAEKDYFDINTWQLLNSYYYISNSFKDYCRDFKTVEQRRHEKALLVMWATFIVAFLTLIATICSCDRTRTYSTIEDNTEPVPKTKTRSEILEDSIVSLSFQGFTLGKPLSIALKKAQENNRVWNVRRNGDETTGKTSIMLLVPNKSLTTDFTIFTYRDTIYYITIKSSSDIAFGNIADLYAEKYGQVSRYDFERPDATYNPNNNKRYEWSYSNQRIIVSEQDYVMTIRDYMNKDEETLKFFLNCRDHSVYVYYTDFAYQHKAHVADSIKRDKEELIRAKQQHVQDSINKIKAEKRRNTAIQQI